MSNLTCLPIMLPSLSTLLAKKFRPYSVGGMFAYAQDIFTNICCSKECCRILPLLANNSTHSVKISGRNMHKSLVHIATSTRLFSKWRCSQWRKKNVRKCLKFNYYIISDAYNFYPHIFISLQDYNYFHNHLK